MKMLSVILLAALLSCTDNAPASHLKTAVYSAAANVFLPAKFSFQDSVAMKDINTAGVTPDELMNFAETQIGVPYVYASCDPKVGFDCSGFITYVFNHFNIQVPRSSYGFTHIGKKVPFEEAKRGDILLFTGTDSLSTDAGHIGLVVSHNNGVLVFIHATSGKAMAVTVTTFDARYKKRFLRICRVFRQNV